MSSSHEEHVHATKKMLDRQDEISKSRDSLHEEGRHSNASLKHEETLLAKKKAAHLSSEDVDEARKRKELYDRLEESEKHRKQHDLELKQELAQANRHDIIEGIKEKQHHLQ